MGGGEGIKGLAEYKCSIWMQRSPEMRSYKDTFRVSVPQVFGEQAAQTDARLYKAASEYLKNVVGGCIRKQLLGVTREK